MHETRIFALHTIKRSILYSDEQLLVVADGAVHGTTRPNKFEFFKCVRFDGTTLKSNETEQFTVVNERTRFDNEKLPIVTKNFDTNNHLNVKSIANSLVYSINLKYQPLCIEK